MENKDLVTRLYDELARMEWASPGARDSALGEWGVTVRSASPQGDVVSRIIDAVLDFAPRSDLRRLGLVDVRSVVLRCTAHHDTEPGMRVPRWAASWVSRCGYGDAGKAALANRVLFAAVKAGAR